MYPLFSVSIALKQWTGHFSRI